jgi:hypothetical protein
MGMEKKGKAVFNGKCYLCEQTLAKNVMTRHLGSCRKESHAQDLKAGSRKGKIFHLLVEGLYNPWYWMHFELRGEAKLWELDDFLRRIWLECCHHMSAFSIEGVRYSVQPLQSAPGLSGFGPRVIEKSMEAALKEVLRKGLKFSYEYDFGTTTDLGFKVIDEREGRLPGHKLRILARNDPPEIMCSVCREKPAKRICSQCAWDDGGWLCEGCAEKHECDEEMFLPIVNSPRAGQCAYTGPGDP